MRNNRTRWICVGRTQKCALRTCVLCGKNERMRTENPRVVYGEDEMRTENPRVVYGEDETMRTENPRVVYGEDGRVEMLTFCMFHVIFGIHHIKEEKRNKRKNS